MKSDEKADGYQITAEKYRNYLKNSWNGNKKVDFYILKGIIENLFDYLGFNNRYSFKVDEINDLHPGIGAKILLDKESIGIIGKVHPSISKKV